MKKLLHKNTRLCQFFGVFTVKIHRCQGLKNADLRGKSDPYVIVKVGDTLVGTTKTIMDDLNPVYEQEFSLEIRGLYTDVVITVFDWDENTKDDKIGRAKIPCSQVKDTMTQMTLNLKPKGTITLSLCIKPVDTRFDVPNALSPARKGCRAAFFQNAHVGEDAPPKAFTDKPKGKYIHRNCFEEIFDAIVAAKKFIYITGWSVNTDITLIRRGPPERQITLGELLKRKAQEGVRVRLHLWDEALSSSSDKEVLTRGLMNTCDEHTKLFFKDTPVQVLLSYRRRDEISPHRKAISVIGYSHHQKTVILDAESKLYPAKRRIVAFIGGLDLTSGRWDTPKHHLFATLRAEHANDFYQKWPIGMKNQLGPRGPWRDIHSYVEGPIARDILGNFLQRWNQQASGGLSPSDAPDPALDPIFITAEQEEIDQKTKKPGPWSIQMLRSIDNLSALVPERGSFVEKSIQDAYLNSIRASKRFVYIENQYFIGSSNHWNSKNTGAPNQVPYELARRIVAAIHQGQRYCAYIVIPMYPEGFPGKSHLQEILRWQRSTMEMMYREVADALKTVGSRDHPTDYLSFYCLGARVTQGPPKDENTDAYASGSGFSTTAAFSTVSSVPSTTDSSSESYDDLTDAKMSCLRAYLSKRYQIYVHSKFMVVDDAYAIIGSANINERSLAGNRDTEIAIGAYQTHHLSEKPRGYVHKFRMAVWSALLNDSKDFFLTPEKAETMRYINKIGKENWNRYVHLENNDLPFPLMSYPIQVSQEGKVKSVEKYIPDTYALLEGKSSLLLPDFLTM